jgi:hypothetical protein
MRRLLVAAVLACAAAPAVPATALPPDCERYGDKPCIVFCEVYGDSWRPVQMLVENAPPDPFCS